MEELHAADDQSHYEISLTAGQAFVAFVLLMLSLAASFAFGLMIGKGQADDRLVVQKETPVVSEAAMTPKKDQGRIVELGVSDDEFQESEPSAEPAPTEPVTVTETTPVASTAAVIEEAQVEGARRPEAGGTAAEAAAPQEAPAPAPRVAAQTTYAQLLSTENKVTAEALAAKLIDGGFTAAYVERGSTARGPLYRVRVKFDSEPAARAAEARLRDFSKEVWITTR